MIFIPPPGDRDDRERPQGRIVLVGLLAVGVAALVVVKFAASEDGGFDIPDLSPSAGIPLIAALTVVLALVYVLAAGRK